MTSKYLGTSEITVAGRQVMLKYDWAAVSKIMTQFGAEIFTSIFKATPAQLAEMIVIGAQDSDLTIDAIMQESPPLLPIMKAVDRAISCAYFGPDLPVKDDGKKKSEDKSEKTK